MRTLINCNLPPTLDWQSAQIEYICAAQIESRDLCCTGPDLLANYNASVRESLNMSVRFDGAKLSVYLGLDCTSREIFVHNGTKNVTINSFIGSLSKCISGTVIKRNLEVGLSLVPAALNVLFG